MIEPHHPDRDDRAWRGLVLGAAALFLLMTSGVVRAWIDGRL